MPAEGPGPDDARERLQAHMLRLRELVAEKEAVIERIREYVALWTQDKRMRVAGEMLLREIERCEREEAERTRREGRSA